MALMMGQKIPQSDIYKKNDNGQLIGQIDPKRSMIMARVRGKDTVPEMVVRRILHSNGYRYRLHARELFGCPDVVFRPSRKAIFVHGCFWHRHQGCARASMPKTRIEFWERKFAQNCARDFRNQEELRYMNRPGNSGDRFV